jgi:hypothetical protein
VPIRCPQCCRDRELSYPQAVSLELNQKEAEFYTSTVKAVVITINVNHVSN